MVDFEAYHRRINAMNYALTHDDGVSMDYSDAELILIGVSRAGKTPTCVYLALHYGVRAANYPLTEEDLESDRLPAKLRPLSQRNCSADDRPVPPAADPPGTPAEFALRAAWKRASAKWPRPKRCYGRSDIPMLSTTHASIEEISSRVLEHLGINREMF